ncbi:MAG: hypothetical protein WD069_13295 [Planctomycetales bacterium]
MSRSPWKVKKIPAGTAAQASLLELPFHAQVAKLRDLTAMHVASQDRPMQIVYGD